jgi:hypothetical protein
MTLAFLGYFVVISATLSGILAALCALIAYRYVSKKTEFIKDEEALLFSRKVIPRVFVDTVLFSCAGGILLGVGFSFAAPFLGLPAIHQFLGPYAFFVLGALIGINSGWMRIKFRIEVVLKNYTAMTTDRL